MLSNAVISAFKTPVVVFLSNPIPLVAPVTGKFEILSEAEPSPAAVPKSAPASLPLLVPATPPATLPLFW